MDGWVDEWKDGWMDGRKEGRKKEREEGKKEGWMECRHSRYRTYFVDLKCIYIYIFMIHFVFSVCTLIHF